MRVAIVGAGIAGLSAAYDLLAAGHQVTLYEAADMPGGLAVGFKDERWEWPLEHFYHHLFRSDADIIGLVEELGIGNKLFWPAPTTSIWYQNAIYPFSNPRDWLRFPGYNLVDFFRFGVVGAFLRFTRFWRHLEKETAVNWTRRWYGQKIYEISWRPLMIAKFGPYYADVSMAWLWARLFVRSFKLGYFEGGFQLFVDSLAQAVQERGGRLRLSSAVSAIHRADGQMQVHGQDGTVESYDHVLATIAPQLVAKLARQLPEEYLRQLLSLKNMGAVVLILALRHQLTPQTYWLNLPTDSADKLKEAIPFAALIEHTNYIDRGRYGGDHIVYLGDYVLPDHPYLTMSEEALRAHFTRALTTFNPKYSDDWIRRSWLFRTPYAQPVPLVGHSANIPAITTPLSGLTMANMSQVYPWDRGTNFAVQIGRKAASLIATGEEG